MNCLGGGNDKNKDSNLTMFCLAIWFASSKPRRPPGLLQLVAATSIHSQPSAALSPSLACWACMKTQGPDRLTTCCCSLSSIVGRRYCFSPTSLVWRTLEMIFHLPLDLLPHRPLLESFLVLNME